MMMRARSIKTRQRGFTLLELLLTVGLAALLISGMYSIFDDWSERAINRTAATELMQLQNAAKAYVLANFDEIRVETTPSVGAFGEIPLVALTTQGFLPVNYQGTNAFRQTMRIFRRVIRTQRIDGTGANIPGQFYTTIEVMTVSDGGYPIPNTRLGDIMRASGPRMGIVSQMVHPVINFNNNIGSIHNAWQIPKADLAAAGYTDNSTPNSASGEGGGYLAAYDRVDTELTDVNDEWLYRISVPGRPELNEMRTNIAMNNNPIKQVGTLVADKINVTNNAAFLGKGVTALPTDTAQAMTVDQALRVDGTDVTNPTNPSRINLETSNPAACPTSLTGDLRTIGGAGCTVSGGELSIIAETGDANMEIGTLSNGHGTVITDLATVGGTVTSGGISAFNDLTTAQMRVNGRVAANKTTVDGGTIRTNKMSSGNLHIAAGGTVGDTLVTTNMSSNLTARDMTVVDQINLTGNFSAKTLGVTGSSYIENGTQFTDKMTGVGNGRQIVCTVSGPRTYCEPTGTFTWTNGVQESCVPYGNGYKCTHTKGAAFIGECRYTRDTGANNQALHKANCCATAVGCAG